MWSVKSIELKQSYRGWRGIGVKIGQGIGVKQMRMQTRR